MALKNLSGTEVGFSKSHLTYKQGTVVCTFDDLVEAFGQPDFIPESGQDKSQVEWIIEKDGIVATIYDWNQLDTDLNEISIWNIGGKSYEASLLVNEVIEKACNTESDALISASEI